MTSFDKQRRKLFKTPIPCDITFDDLTAICRRYHCTIVPGGNHMKIQFVPPDGCPIQRRIIPIPRHGKYVKPVYIAQVKQFIIEYEEFFGRQ